jgi:hypothetical protein
MADGGQRMFREGNEAADPVDEVLKPGEKILLQASDVTIKKSRFRAFFTNHRLFLLDNTIRGPAVAAKEIPRDAIVGASLESSDQGDSIVALSVKTSDDEIRQIKMHFNANGEDRTVEAGGWVQRIAGSLAPIPSPNIPSPKAPALPTQPADGVQERVRAPPIFAPVERVRTGPIAIKKEEGVAKEAPVPDEGAPTLPQRNSGPIGDGSRDQVQFCFHCGKKVPRMANFCPFCGTTVHHAPVQEGRGQVDLHITPQEPPPTVLKKLLKR